MAWKTITSEDLAQELGIDYSELKEKHALIDQVKAARKSQRLTQKALADRVGVSQSMIAQIESGIGTKKHTFDLLFKILSALGKDCRVVTLDHKIHRKISRIEKRCGSLSTWVETKVNKISTR